MRCFIDLWETRNKDMQGHTKTEQNSRLEAKHQKTFRNMLAQKLNMRSCDHWLFPDNPTLFSYQLQEQINLGHGLPPASIPSATV